MIASAQSLSVLQREFNTSWATSWDPFSKQRKKKGGLQFTGLPYSEEDVGFITRTENSNADHSHNVEVSWVRFPVISKRQYFIEESLVLWLLKSFCPLFSHVLGPLCSVVESVHPWWLEFPGAMISALWPMVFCDSFLRKVSLIRDCLKGLLKQGFNHDYVDSCDDTERGQLTGSLSRKRTRGAWWLLRGEEIASPRDEHPKLFSKTKCSFLTSYAHKPH